MTTAYSAKVSLGKFVLFIKIMHIDAESPIKIGRMLKHICKAYYIPKH